MLIVLLRNRSYSALPRAIDVCCMLMQFVIRLGLIRFWPFFPRGVERLGRSTLKILRQYNILNYRNRMVNNSSIRDN